MVWLNKIIQIFKIPELRKKILFVLAVFAIFRFMANIPVPGVDAAGLSRMSEQGGPLSLFSLFTGGALDNFSIVMLGMGPYITAIIIFQLLTMIFPALEKMYKEEGERGRQKFNQYARIATVPLAALQAYAMISIFERQGFITGITPSLLLTSIITITAGSIFLMWLGELITEKGIGNGVSLLIFAGIIAQFPISTWNLIQQVQTDPSMGLSVILFFVISLVIIMGVVLINEARRNIPVSYAKRVRGMRMYGGVSTYLPLNINPAGVIPIIFAISIMMIPGMISQFLGGAEGFIGDAARSVSAALQTGSALYSVLLFFMIVLFTYFYTAVTFDPKAIAQNLQKMGGFVPGIRPGENTAKFMYFILNRVLIIGAVFLGLIAIMPAIVQGFTHIQQFSFLVGGTSLLIVVSVVLETLRQIRAQLQMRDYESF